MCGRPEEPRKLLSVIRVDAASSLKAEMKRVSRAFENTVVFTLLTPASVKSPILDCLCNVMGLDGVRGIEVCNGLETLRILE